MGYLLSNTYYVILNAKHRSKTLFPISINLKDAFRVFIIFFLNEAIDAQIHAYYRTHVCIHFFSCLTYTGLHHLIIGQKYYLIIVI